MSKENLSNIPHDEVRTVSVTESYHGDRPAKQDRLVHADVQGPVLTIGISQSDTDEPYPADQSDHAHPLEGLNFDQVREVQVLNENYEELTKKQYLLGVDPWEDDGHLHIFTDESIE